MAIQYADLNAFVNDFIAPDLHDLMYQPSPVFARLHERRREDFTGGILIREPVIVGKLWCEAVGRDHTVDVSFVTTEAAIVESMRYYLCNVTLYAFDAIQNSGPESVFSQLETKIRNAGLRMAEVVAADMYTNNAANPEKITGFYQWYDDGTNVTSVGGQTRSDIHPVGSVGGLNAYTINLGSTFTLPELNRAYMEASYVSELPDLITTSRNGFHLIWTALHPLQRYTTGQEGWAGFQSIRFNAADVVYDPLIPSGVSYILNTNHIKLYFSTNRAFYFGFTGFKEPPDSTNASGQFRLAISLIVVNPRTGAKVLCNLF